MSDGPSELILLSAGLIVAALVSGVLLGTWDDMSGILDERGKQGAEDVRTRISLTSDPINIAWETDDHVTIWVQNSGDTFLDVNSVGAAIAGITMTVSVADGSEEWLPGQTVQFTLTSTTLHASLEDGDNDLQMSVTASSTASGYTGVDSIREDVRIVKP